MGSRWEGNSRGEVVETAEDDSEDGVGDENGQRRADAVVESEEAGWFEVAGCGRAVVFTGHARVKTREDWKDDD